VAIYKATKSFVAEVAGTRHEGHKGDLRSSTDPVVQERPDDFAPASEEDVRKAVEKARA
jgi:hypothetical protein